jgi:hypothetical protein
LDPKKESKYLLCNFNQNISFAASEEFMQESNPTMRLVIPYSEHASTAKKNNIQGGAVKHE